MKIVLREVYFVKPVDELRKLFPEWETDNWRTNPQVVAYVESHPSSSFRHREELYDVRVVDIPDSAYWRIIGGIDEQFEVLAWSYSPIYLES